jgi:LacI family transcriptional regulator
MLTGGPNSAHPWPPVNRFARSDAPVRRTTIADVAARAGLSKTTVSHVLSRNRPVSGATRERVERAIAELGYRPNRLARSLRTQRTHAVALLIPDITNPFYPVMSRGLEDTLEVAGYRTFVCNTDGEEAREAEFLSDVGHRGVDGVVMVTVHLTADEVGRLTGHRVPFVAVGSSRVSHPTVDVVLADDRQGAYDATRLLIERGHRRVAMAGGTPGTGTRRHAGYRLALSESGMVPDPDLFVYGHWTRRGGREAARGLMALDDPPTALFCANDMMAMGVLDVAGELGLNVPRDLAVVGYDDLEWASLVRPRLTTVANPAYDTGRSAGNLLLDRMTGRYHGVSRTVSLPCRLVVRETA